MVRLLQRASLRDRPRRERRVNCRLRKRIAESRHSGGILAVYAASPHECLSHRLVLLIIRYARASSVRPVASAHGPEVRGRRWRAGFAIRPPRRGRSRAGI